MEKLVEQLRIALASTFAFYLKAHNFHWNVEGPNFLQYHQLFEEIYTDTWDAVDGIAEHIRALNAFAPGSLSRYATLSIVDDQINFPSAFNMVKELESDNKKVVETLMKAHSLAEQAKAFGLINYLEDRIDHHNKMGWMLKATIKAQNNG